MGAASLAQRSEYIQELGHPYLSLFPFRYSYISAPFCDPGQKPDWVTETRHPLSDRRLLQGGRLFGVRFDSKTRYCLLDIDIDSPYHPKQDPFAIGKIKEALEPLELLSCVACTSSYSGGLHLYFPFKKAQRSWQVASAVATLLENKGFKIRGGQLEVFPNTKKYVQAGSPSLFNAHRLPLQEPGSRLLNEDGEAIYSSPERFAQVWGLAQAKNALTGRLLTQVLKQYKRQKVFVSEKANKFFNDLEAEINLGWTDKGMTNRLLGRLVMRYFIFHHAVAGGEPLTGQALINEVVAAAKALPGYKAFCQHQHELTKRVTDWVRSIENSHYFPYGKELGKYKAPNAAAPKPSESYHETLVAKTKQKIIDTVEALKQLKTWPKEITKRFKALLAAGIGSSSLYRYKSLWHPKFEIGETRPGLCECPPAGPEGAAELAHSHKLITQTPRNHKPEVELSDLITEEEMGGSRNFSSPNEFQGLGPAQIIQKTKELLAQAQSHPPWKASQAGSSSEIQDSIQRVAHHRAFIETHLGYLASGEAVLASEALTVLKAQMNPTWGSDDQAQYAQLLVELKASLSDSTPPSAALISRCRSFLLSVRRE